MEIRFLGIVKGKFKYVTTLRFNFICRLSFGTTIAEKRTIMPELIIIPIIIPTHFYNTQCKNKIIINLRRS